MPNAALHSLYLLAGLCILWVGGEALVRGASRLARRLGISALVVGLTVVAFGTSAPELAVSLQAALHDSPGLAVGNVVGSNIANILLILGAAAAARPMPVSLNLLRFDGPLMVIVSVVFLAMALLPPGSGAFGRIDGIILAAGLLSYIVFTYHAARREPKAVEAEYESAQAVGGSTPTDLFLVMLGIIGLTFGGQLIVEGASELARLMNIDETLIGLTVVAVGTSLPELATSIIAARHSMPDIALGNVVGSNLFNMLCVIGVTSTIHPLPVEASTVWLDGPVMLGASVLFLLMARTGQRISRREGAGLLILYGGYLAWTVVRGAAGARAA